MAEVTTTDSNLTRSEQGRTPRDRAKRRAPALARLSALSPRAWGALVFGVAFSTGLFMVLVVFKLQHQVEQDIDPYYFGKMGQSIAHGHGFEGFGSLIKRRAPLYPLTIGGLYAAFGDHTTVVLVVHSVMFAATATLAFDIARRLFNLRTGVIAGLLCALQPMLLRYVPTLHLETQLTLLYTLLIWLMLRFRKQPTLLNGVFVGVVAAGATLTKAPVALLPVAFVVGLLLERRSAARRSPPTLRRDRPVARAPWRSLFALFAVMGLTILPWTIRNYQVTGHFVPVSSGTSDAFLRGFIFSETKYITLSKPPYTDAENASNAYFRRLAADAGTVWEADDFETDQILNKEAKRRLIHEPGAVARKTVVGLFTFWYQLTSFKNSVLALTLAVGGWILALIGWRRARSEGISTWVVFTGILYLNLVLAPLLALGRYSVPVIPVLMVMAAYGIDTLLGRRARTTDA
jgi:4-amino-4-deoxy-L-arabinose transferase-like glycosyltransferase